MRKSSSTSKKIMKGSFHRIIEVMDAMDVMDTMVVIDIMSAMIFYEILDSKRVNRKRRDLSNECNDGLCF